MSDELTNPRGPIMLCATSVMKPGPARVGKLTKSIVLPRTVALTTLISGGLGAFVTLIAALPFFSSLQSMMMAAALGGCAGVFLTTYSPLKGESMFKWLGLLALTSTKRSHKVYGQSARLYVGICPIPTEAEGRVRIVTGSSTVPSGSVDERGCFIPDAAQQNPGILHRLGSRDAVAYDTTAIPDSLPTERVSEFVFHRAVPAAHAPNAWLAAAADKGPQLAPLHPQHVAPIVTGPLSGVPTSALQPQRPDTGPRPIVRGGVARPTPPGKA